MDAQVLGRYPADQLAEFGVDGVAAPVTRAGDERDRLFAGIDAARRRVVAVRAELAGAQDPALRLVWAAQQTLAGEQDATDRVVAAIESDADDEVERMLGYRPARPGHHHRRHGRPRGAESSAEMGWLQSELDRLVKKAEALEHQIGLLSRAPARPAIIDPALLETLMAQAVAATRDEHRRARERAMRAAEHQLAAARESREHRDAPMATAAPVAAPGPAWPNPVADLPGRQAPAPEVAAWGRSPSTELVLLPPADARNGSGGNSGVGRAGPDRRAVRAKPMLLDVVLPLIAVAIVLLVVLSWIG